MKKTYKYGLKDLSGKPVPDSKITSTGRDLFDSTGDYNIDKNKGIGAYKDNDRVLLSSVDLDKYEVKFIAGLWRIREKQKKSYKIVNVWDKRLVIGDKINIKERDDFGFEYYTAAEEKYDKFNVLTPEFNMYVATCKTIRGSMSRYGMTREEARAFLRGAIMDTFSHNIASIVIGHEKRKQRNCVQK